MAVEDMGRDTIVVMVHKDQLDEYGHVAVSCGGGHIPSTLENGEISTPSNIHRRDY